MRRSSVLELKQSFRVKTKFEGQKEKLCVIFSAYRWWFNDRDEIRVLTVVLTRNKFCETWYLPP